MLHSNSLHSENAHSKDRVAVRTWTTPLLTPELLCWMPLIYTPRHRPKWMARPMDGPCSACSSLTGRDRADAERAAAFERNAESESRRASSQGSAVPSTGPS